MVIISHRGNINGPNKLRENSPDYINEALSLGLNVEVDVWHKDDSFWLGHDKPEYKVSVEMFANLKLWCHAKNIKALEHLNKIGANCFWHQADDFTLTSNGFIWTYPGKELNSKSICVLPETFNGDFSEVKKSSGICTDYPFYYSSILSQEK